MRPYFVVVALLACSTAGRAQVVPRPSPTTEAQIAAAEDAGAAFPRKAEADAPPRKCILVRPEQIVFPETRGNPADYTLVSGEFSAASISFGWDATYEQGKMPLTPRHPTAVGNGLTLTITRIDPPGESTTLQIFTFPRNEWFFPTWPRFPTPGRWMLVATAGVNWGCFVIERPVKK